MSFPLNRTPDLAIVGAGPAGLAAAVEARNVGLDVVVLDEQPNPGGQIYRALESNAGSVQRGRILGKDYLAGLQLIEAFRSSGTEYMAGASVWSAERDGTLGVMKDGSAFSLKPRRTVLATGAYERPFHIPGWTLPGVMTAGAGQILLKSSNVVPDVPTVLVGTGPLLLLLAVQYLRAGCRVEAIVLTSGASDLRKSFLHLPQAMRAPSYLTKGLSMIAEIWRRRVPVFFGASGLKGEGEYRLEAVSFSSAGRPRRVKAELMLLHNGVIPDTSFTRALRADHHWDRSQRCWNPVVDAWGNLSVEPFAVAGDGAGIGGAKAAAFRGRLAGLEAARAVGRLTEAERDQRAAGIRANLGRDLAARPFLDRAFSPPRLEENVTSETVICRCEEVTLAEIERSMESVEDSNQVKALTRCGMGPCCGRQCTSALAEVVGGQEAGELSFEAAPRARPPVKRITLRQLATLEQNP